MILWRPFQNNGITYDLSHLNPVSFKVEQPTKGDKPSQIYKITVDFGLHCFTNDFEGAVFNSAESYSDARETRIFNYDRYNLSKLLPEIIAGLANRKCYHTGKGNFFTVEIAAEGANTREYEVYFTVSRSSTKGVLNLSVQSAYVRDSEHRSRRPKSIGFFVILFNTLNGRPIKPPPQ
jgi:hypothetical protein